MRYWNSEGKYQKQQEELFEALVPDMGSCDTLGGEVLRAASRIYYDAYNNGFCNNTSGAFNFLVEYVPGMEQHLRAIEDYVNSEEMMPRGSHEAIDDALDGIMDTVIEWIQNNPDAKQENTSDLFDLQEDDFEYEEEEDDVWYFLAQNNC